MSGLTACPICAQTLVDGVDVLSIRWYAPRQWWVLDHKVNGEHYCGQADRDGSRVLELMHQSGVVPRPQATPA